MNQTVNICGRRGGYSVRNPVPFNSVVASPPLQPWKVILPRQHHLLASALTTANRVYSKLVESPVLHSNPNQDEDFDGEELSSIPHVQTLRQFPREELSGKFVLVRFDSKLLLQQLQEHSSLLGRAISTVKYLHKSGARITLVSSWDAEIDGKILTSESLAGYLSLLLELKVVPVQFIARKKHTAKQETEILLLENLLHLKAERANCKGLAEKLSTGMDIFVNDAFYESHKSLSSTVGISRFCYSCIAGFYFEAGLSQLKHIMRTSKRPYMAIVSIYKSLCFKLGEQIFKIKQQQYIF